MEAETYRGRLRVSEFKWGENRETYVQVDIPDLKSWYSDMPWLQNLEKR